MKIKALGTISPYCKNDLCCPGFLIENGSSKILLDAGSGITRYLHMQEDLKNLTIIISHLHKDHYADLLSIGYATFVLHNLGFLKDKVKVYLPQKNINMTEQELVDYYYLKNFKEDNYLEFLEYSDQTVLNIDDMKITFNKNIHPVTTYACKVESKEKTVVYSSDTGYKNNTLAAFSKNTDVLICEASFLEGQEKKRDYHLYASEAALIAKRANVGELILTHFYPEIEKELYLKEAQKVFKKTKVAEEGKYFY